MTTLTCDLTASHQQLSELQYLLDVIEVLADYYQVPLTTTISLDIHADTTDPRLIEHIRLLLNGAQADDVAAPAPVAAPAHDDPSAWDDDDSIRDGDAEVAHAAVEAAFAGDPADPAAPACPDCGVPVSTTGRRCRTCAGKARTGMPRQRRNSQAHPDPEEVRTFTPPHSDKHGGISAPGPTVLVDHDLPADFRRSISRTGAIRGRKL